MIYDIRKYELEDLLKDVRLITAITEQADVSVSTAKQRIHSAYERTLVYSKPKPVKTSDHPPCPNCGGIDFQRTGTCHVCITCGSSQGCS